MTTATAETTPGTTGETVLVVGGGLAGLAAAAALAPRGFRVRLLESRHRLGGRAGSFTDPATGQMVDACQHVSMGCCTNLDHFCRLTGIDHFLQPQRTLWFMTPDRRVSRFRADPFPAPFHLARAFLGLHFLTPAEKLRIAWGLDRLRRTDPESDPPFADWLRENRQTPATIDRFWGLVLVSALNESPDRCGLKYARKVFVEGFLGHPKAFEVSVPTVPLGRLYGDELGRWLASHGVSVATNRAAESIEIDRDRVAAVNVRQGIPERADWYVVAVPFQRLPDLMPADTVEANEPLRNLKQLETSPITSVHAWFDRPVVRRPHVVLVDGVGQWVFSRGEVAPGEWYLQVVVSNSRGLRRDGHEAARGQVLDELGRLFPAARGARLLRSRVVTEVHATFSAVPAVDRWRPSQALPLKNAVLAGDWTATGWPATMEGAVRSGYLAAEEILRRAGRPDRVVRAGLG